LGEWWERGKIIACDSNPYVIGKRTPDETIHKLALPQGHSLRTGDPMSENSGDAASPKSPVILWFRDDLRLADNPALVAAAQTGSPLLAVYVLDDQSEGLRRPGAASRWWLHGSLASLQSDVERMGGSLLLFKGEARQIIPGLARAVNAQGVFWNRRYDAPERVLDASIKDGLKAAGIQAKSFNSHLLNEPWEVKSKAGTPMKVFTPYWRAARERGEPAAPIPAPDALSFAPFSPLPALTPVTLDDLGLKPVKPDWAQEMAGLWQPGETGAAASLAVFLSAHSRNYADNRNRPDMTSTSRLSPHLRFGEISPRQIWHAAQSAQQAGASAAREHDLDKFLAEIGWREFSYHLLDQFPRLASENFQARFNAFPWMNNPTGLKAWQKGQTGYPIVDAGMRQLWRTGWMHNRVRMITASFLIKHLMVDWRQGEAWFWDTLVDADPASNAASWQWVAGSGADAAPYYRIFAPVVQGEKFDPNGDYVRRYVPELAKLPNSVIHQPWAAPHPVLSQAGITLGIDYPHPVVDHSAARQRALAAFKSLSVGTEA
jgi:deoxyribodipyrimidine photo-lyase